jgi:glycosyltransferase involved in cell wall biosynthesis
MSLSICITVKNRSSVETDNGTLHLFPNCIDSIARSLQDIDAEIVITDWESDDWPIKKWILDKTHDIPVHLVTLKGKYFSRGRGLNFAAQQASNNILFFMDADMIVDHDVLRNAYNEALKGNVYIPECKYYINEGRDFTWNWGVGNMCMPSDIFYKAGKWPEYGRWGFEDHDFLEKLKNYNIIYRRDGEFVHQWHPNDENWKNRYSDKSEKSILEIQDRREEHKKIVRSEEERIEKQIEQYVKINLDKKKYPKDNNLGNDIPRIGDFK